MNEGDYENAQDDFIVDELGDDSDQGLAGRPGYSFTFPMPVSELPVPINRRFGRKPTSASIGKQVNRSQNARLTYFKHEIIAGITTFKQLASWNLHFPVGFGASPVMTLWLPPTYIDRRTDRSRRCAPTITRIAHMVRIVNAVVALSEYDRDLFEVMLFCCLGDRSRSARVAIAGIERKVGKARQAEALNWIGDHARLI